MVRSAPMPKAPPVSVLCRADWRGLRDAHFSRASRHTGPARERRDRGIPHPIADFLFQYYSFPFSHLEHWHPGIGTALEWDGPAVAPYRKHYRSENATRFADPGLLTEKERVRLQRILTLLEATRDRRPVFACHGLHEWAMVYQAEDVRHGGTLPLRLPQNEIDRVVESLPIRCSHYDAFRFFTPAARPFNQFQPTLETRELCEQPACLHANMDLYKWCAKSQPWCGSDLLLDCFELAVELRDLDMRASPYDLSGWNRPPVRIETPEGRRQYESEQRGFADRARPLRGKLIARLSETLNAC
ncbi:MAG: 3-methyladenine DNA glycosylase [Verrucomicrobiales bacterium]